MVSENQQSLDRCTTWLGNLLTFPTVSSTSNVAISDYVESELRSLGFQVERSGYEDDKGVAKANLVAWRNPVGDNPVTGEPQEPDAPSPPAGVAYFCHTDVVPVTKWSGPGNEPFSATFHEGRVYGRGSCDMKGSLATILSAIQTFDVNDQSSPLWVVCTADEEVGFAGAQHLVEHSAAYRNLVRHQPLAIIGEPTRLQVHHAHKGITGFRLTSRGQAAHSSTLQGVNANIAMLPLIQLLGDIERRTREDSRYLDDRFSPPILSWNFGFSDHMTAVNITPPRCDAWCSLRPMPNIDGADLIEEVSQLAKKQDVEITVFDGCPPFWIDADSEFISSLAEMTDSVPSPVCYGTDGGIFTELKHRVILGPGDIAQAHTADEWIEIDQLARGIRLYQSVLRRFCI
ncbi:MAG: M20 family metallopeptidase [Planctomycetota bacterium]